MCTHVLQRAVVFDEEVKNVSHDVNVMMYAGMPHQVAKYIEKNLYFRHYEMHK